MPAERYYRFDHVTVRAASRLYRMRQRGTLPDWEFAYLLMELVGSQPGTAPSPAPRLARLCRRRQLSAWGSVPGLPSGSRREAGRSRPPASVG